jgi:hypothetical protein
MEFGRQSEALAVTRRRRHHVNRENGLYHPARQLMDRHTDGPGCHSCNPDEKERFDEVLTA